jgi:copper chaperone
MSETVQIKIEGMTCGHCTAAVEKALYNVAGVDKVVDISLESGIATIEGTATSDALAAAVKDAGYQVVTD